MRDQMHATWRGHSAPCTDQTSPLRPLPFDTCTGIFAVAVAVAVAPDIATVDGGAGGVGGGILGVQWCSPSRRKRSRRARCGTRLSHAAVAGGGGPRVYKSSRFPRLELLPFQLTRTRQRNCCIPSASASPAFFVVIDNTTRIHVSQISQPQCSRCSSKAHPTAPAAPSTNSPPSAALPATTATAASRPPACHCRRPRASSTPSYCCRPLQLTARPHREPGLDAPATPRFGHRPGGSYSRPYCPHVQRPGCTSGCPWPGAHS